MEKHPEEYKIYHDVEKMFKDITNDNILIQNLPLIQFNSARSEQISSV